MNPNLNEQEFVLVADLARYPMNPGFDRDDEYMEGLRESIQAEGIKDPLSVRVGESKAEIRDGNHRFRIAQELGMERVPVRFEWGTDNEIEGRPTNYYNEFEDYRP